MTTRPSCAARRHSEGYDVVVAFGGDGTVNECRQRPDRLRHAAVLPARRPRQRVVPDAGDPRRRRRRDRASARPIAHDWHPRRIDLGRVNDRHFLFSAGVGLDASVVERVDANPRLKARLGEYYYAWAAVNTLHRRYLVHPPRLEADGRTASPPRVSARSFRTPSTTPTSATARSTWPRGPGCSRRSVGDRAAARDADRHSDDRLARAGQARPQVTDHRRVTGFAGFTEMQIRSADERPLPLQVDGDYIGEAAAGALQRVAAVAADRRLTPRRPDGGVRRRRPRGSYLSVARHAPRQPPTRRVRITDRDRRILAFWPSTGSCSPRRSALLEGIGLDAARQRLGGADPRRAREQRTPLRRRATRVHDHARRPRRGRGSESRPAAEARSRRSTRHDVGVDLADRRRAPGPVRRARARWSRERRMRSEDGRRRRRSGRPHGARCIGSGAGWAGGAASAALPGPDRRHRVRAIGSRSSSSCNRRAPPAGSGSCRPTPAIRGSTPSSTWWRPSRIGACWRRRPRRAGLEDRLYVQLFALVGRP